MKHKTILVSCHIQDSPQAIPLAASILKSYISDLSNISVNLLDFYINQTPEEASAKIIEEKPHSVGFSIYIWNRHFFEKTAALIKKHNQAILIYAGGADVTASAEKISENVNFDYLIQGEGELPFEKLMKRLSLHESLSNIDNKCEILEREHIVDLNTIPSPFLKGVLDVSEWDGVLWELSRGCPYKCAFCAESRGVGGVRYFNEERIVKELQLFEEKKVEQIFVLDPTFNIDKKRALKILSLIGKYAPYIHFTFEIRAELLDEEMAQMFADVHCSLQIGLQSADKKVLKKVNRTLDKQLFSRKISLLNQSGAVFGLDLIFGLPGDTYQGFLSSLDYALMLIPNHLDVFRLSVFPGTELYDNAESLEINFLNTAPYTVNSIPGYDSDDLEKSQHIANAVNLFYNKGRSAPWLLSITDILNISPSLFFSEFSNFLQETQKNDSPVFEIQQSFLKDIFKKYDIENFLPIALDLSQFHHLYSEALNGEPDFNSETPQKFTGTDTIYKQSPLLKIGIFSYDVTTYSEMGMIEIDSFSRNNFSEKSYGVIFNNGYEILTMGVEKHLYNFIEEIDGIKSIEEILIIINKEVDEIRDFIDFLVESALFIAVS